MKRSAVDVLLQVAYLERAITAHGAYEGSVLRKKPRTLASAAVQKVLEERLAVALEEQAVPVTVGSFLKLIREEQKLRPQELFSRMGVTQNVYRMLEYDRISPLRISADVWRRFAQLFNVSSENLVALIQRTHRLVFFGPSLQITLARYDARKNKAMKKETMRQAGEELFLRANLSLPVQEQRKLDMLVKAIRDGD